MFAYGCSSMGDLAESVMSEDRIGVLTTTGGDRVVTYRQLPVLLTARESRHCARRVHNESDPNIEKTPWEVPTSLQARFDAGNAFESAVLAELRAELGPDRYVDLSEMTDREAMVDATISAMSIGCDLIIQGWLPDDLNGGRKGRPDLLVRVGEQTYIPGEIKGHQMTRVSAKGRLLYSTLASPAEPRVATGRQAEASKRVDDYLQLAHYWRMLEAIGRTPSGPAIGVLVGTDSMTDLDPTGRVLTWVDLDTSMFQTYSRSSGKTKRTALERYDHEQGFRLKVARQSAAGGPALVEPIFTEECDACPWYDYCSGVADPKTPSLHIRSGRLSVREWTALATLGISTIDELADLDIDEKFQTAYLAEVTHVSKPLDRLRDATRRAQMICDGVSLERTTTGPIEIPRGDLEIDFDIEWDPEGHVYLWGALVSRGDAEPSYHATVSWDPMNEADDVRLAEEFATWLRRLLADAGAAAESVWVYHYDKPEPRYLTKLVGADRVADLLDRFVDMHEVIAENYFGLHGLGIKKVAPVFGFDWQDEDPGGLQSQQWLVDARMAPADTVERNAARDRILSYNRDDVHATRAVRLGL